MIINGKQIASEILEELKKRPKPEKFFAGVLIGDDPASESFQKLKQKTAAELGIDYRIYRLSPELGNDGLRKEVGRISAQKTCGGGIVQLPLPEHINKHYILNVIPREKDVDVLGNGRLALFIRDGILFYRRLSEQWKKFYKLPTTHYQLQTLLWLVWVF